MSSYLQYEKVSKIVGLMLPVEFLATVVTGQRCCKRYIPEGILCRNIPLHADYSHFALISACLCSISVNKKLHCIGSAIHSVQW